METDASAIQGFGGGKCVSENGYWRAQRARRCSKGSLAQARNDCESLKTARMLEITDGDMLAAQKRMAKLIRDVDKCITLISEK